MSVRLVQRPIYVVECNHSGVLPCGARWRPVREFDQGSENLARGDAERNGGWQVRPAYGKGARSAPDLCPKHRSEVSE